MKINLTCENCSNSLGNVEIPDNLTEISLGIKCEKCFNHNDGSIILFINPPPLTVLNKDKSINHRASFPSEDASCLGTNALGKKVKGKPRVKIYDRY